MQKSSKSSAIALVVLSIRALVFPVHAQSAEFIPIGFLPGMSGTEAYGFSADGTVVVGRAVGAGRRAFRWTLATGIQALGNLPGRTNSMAWGVSADGSVIVGDSETAVSVQGCRWNTARQMQLLGRLPGFSYSSASAISANGTVIVGTSEAESSEAVRWTAGVATGIGDLPGQQVYSTAFGTNDDGSVIVGFGQSISGIEAFRWTSADGMVGLGDLAGGAFYSTALSVSKDGSTVVGWANGLPGVGAQAFRWTRTDGMRGLGMLPGANSSVARGVCRNGEIVVGASNFFGGRAFLWTDSDGMVDLKAHLVSLGATGLSGWTLQAANSISSNGRFIVGQGLDTGGHTQAYLAILPISCDGDLNGDRAIGLQDLAILLGHLGQTEGATTADGDADADGDVDLQDLARLLAVFGETC